MRNPTSAELELIHQSYEDLEDLENARQLMEAKLRDCIHQLRRKCKMPGNAQLDADTLSIWVQRKQTQAGVLEIPVVKEEEK